MELTGLKYLLAVAEAGSFTAAARNLDVHASALSRQVYSIECELGVTVFERDHSGVRLTSAGQAVLIYVRQALADIEAILKVGNKGGEGRQGNVRLGVRYSPTHEAIRGLLTRWHHYYPDVLLILHELSDRELCMAVQDRHLDAAILADYAVWSDLAAEPICRERIYAAVPPTHPLAKGGEATWSVLRREHVLVQDWPESHVTRSFYGSLFGHSVRLSSHPAGKASVLGLVASGFGITLATESQAKVGFPGVVFKPVEEDNAFVQIVIAWSPQSEDPAVGRFIAFIRDEARAYGDR